MRLIEKIWFKRYRARYIVVPLLFPLSILFFVLSMLRLLVYKWHLKKSIVLTKPVIVVGNIGVGGNGKTPVVLLLIELCRKLGLTPGVVSRGYGGKAPYYPYLLTENTTADITGDEPLMIAKRTHVAVCIGSDRVAAAKTLIEQGCDIIIADDGLQHYKLARDIEIVVIDGERRFGNGLLLPAGPLREGQWRLDTVDYLINNGSKPHNQEISMRLLPQFVVNAKTGERLSTEAFKARYGKVNAIAGIGYPERFYNTLRTLGLTVYQKQDFVDHHNYQLHDLSEFPADKPLMMTEKDAVKCASFAQEHWWFLTVDAHIPAIMHQQISDHIVRLMNT